jgi:PAS domain S-box-containing protein
MNKDSAFKSKEQLVHENDELVLVLAKMQEILKAITNKGNFSFDIFGAEVANIFSLASGEMSFRVFVEEMNEGASALSSNGMVLYCNKRFAELLNAPSEQIIGKQFDQYLYPDDKTRFLRLLQTGLRKRSQESLRCIRFGDASPVQLHLSVNPFLAGDLEEKVCLIACDDSGTHRVEEELKRMQKSYEQRIAKITASLNKANEELVLSRIAYLNMMQDTVEANSTLKVSNEKLIKQSKKRKKAEKLLKKSESMFRMLLNASPEAIIKMELDGTIKDLSHITTEIFGFKKKNELKGKLFWDFVIPGERMKIQEIFQEALSKRSIQDVETTLLKNDESTFRAEISLTLVEKNNRAPNAYMAIIRDITSRKRMDVQLIHNARLVSLGEMATGIAHEINQPLNTISLTLDNFLYEINRIESIDKNYLKAKSDKIFDNIYKIRDIIEHIRDFSRYQDDHSMVAFDLHKSITNAISMISEEFKFKEIDLMTDFEKTDSHVLGNVYKFEQVILNLLTNAKDALDEKKKSRVDDIRSYVKIHTFSEDQFVFVAVEDNGCGIQPGELDKVLLPFYSTKEEGKGTGLGLSISYGIIKEMNGTFEVQSKPGVGTTMLIRLPLEKREPEEVLEEE